MVRSNNGISLCKISARIQHLNGASNYLYTGAFFLSVSLNPSGKSIFHFPENANYHFLQPVSNHLFARIFDPKNGPFGHFVFFFSPLIQKTGRVELSLRFKQNLKKNVRLFTMAIYLDTLSVSPSSPDPVEKVKRRYNI